MRRFQTNAIVVGITLCLLIASLLFAWIASRRDPIPSPEVVAVPPVEKDGKIFDWEVIGARVYQARCALCHGDGERTARVPSLRDHVPALFLAEGGRTYLMDFMLFGLAGRIAIENDLYDSRHPTYQDRLSDEEVAGVLNYTLVSWSNRDRLPADARLYVPDEVAERRHLEFSPQQLQQIRERIPLGK